MKPNRKKFQLTILGKSIRQSIILNINNVKIRESSSVVLLGLTIDNRPTFKDQSIYFRKLDDSSLGTGFVS